MAIHALAPSSWIRTARSPKCPATNVDHRDDQPLGRVSWLIAPAMRPHPLPHLAEGDEALFGFIPQGEAHAAQAFGERQASNTFQLGISLQHLGQPEERDPARQMMQVMHADIAGEPSERLRQIVERASSSAAASWFHVPWCSQ